MSTTQEVDSWSFKYTNNIQSEVPCMKPANEIIIFAAHRCRYKSKITKRKNCGFDSNFGD